MGASEAAKSLAVVCACACNGIRTERLLPEPLSDLRVSGLCTSVVLWSVAFLEL